jgi:hypothetical protein
MKVSYVYSGGTQWRRWLRNCAKSLKVAGSIPDGVIGFSIALILKPGIDSDSN